MKVFVVVATLVSYALAAPGNYGAVAPAGYAAVHTGSVSVAHPPVTSVHESYHAGPAVAETYVEHGVVGSRTVKVGTQAIQTGHQYNVVGQEVHQPEAYSVVASAPVSSSQTVALPAPALPVAVAAPYAAIPPAPRNLGPAPFDTVRQERILAPVRTHTRITPRKTVITPELHVNRYPVEVQVDVPVPVQRDVWVEKRVPRPYTVEVPRAVAVPKPYKVHPVHEVVHTPVIREHSVSVHQPVVHAVAHQQVAYAAGPVEHAGYAAAAPAYAAEW